ncbi:hypothetical protein CMI44_01645 [Candidatus Pacearchaeota archaeon]|nr:hypothetical protein [Candidatus Pacearchaeota archaeon]
MLFANSYQLNQLDLIPSVSAQAFSCCPKTNDGAICQNVLSDYDNCAKALQQTKCETSVDCKIGCCVDEKEGLCTTKSPKGKCEDDLGVWQGDENCNIFECQKGCCVLGDEIQFVTDKRCEQLSLVFGFEKDFRDLETEYECLALAAVQSQGACVFENKVCKFTTESGCGRLGGDFSENSLCSKKSLDTTCEKQNSTGCLERKAEIYWFDSCGNKENIYSSDKDASWNEGEVLRKEDSCGASSSNADSQDCGNCNYFLGSRCAETNILANLKITGGSIKDGDFICENLNCVDSEGRERVNGESWCVYDSFIGDGKDTVGSRHWKRMCIEGEIKVEQCGDYRGQICIQSEMGNNRTGKNFTMAACVINEANICLNYNSLQENPKAAACQGNEYCVWKEIRITDQFQFDICVGKYPKGSYLTGDEALESPNVCGMASQTCEVLYVKDWKGSWNCEQNCECESSEFSEQMSDLCIGLGDCGSYVNYIGDGTENSEVQNAPGIDWQDYKKYSEPVEGQFAKPKSIAQVLEEMGGGSGGRDGGVAGAEENDFAKGVKLLGMISFGVGALIGGLYMIMATSTITSTIGGMTTTTQTASLLGMKMSGAAATTLGSVGAAAGGVAIGMMVGSLAAKAFDIQGNAALALSIAGGIAGGVAAYAAFKGSNLAAFGIVGKLGPLLGPVIWAVIVVVVMAIVFKIIGWGDTKTVVVKFECMQWEAPLGGDNCKKCDDDILKPCSEYRCESLGKACILLNEDEENPICESIPNDNTPPVISPGEIFPNLTLIQEGTNKIRIKEVGKECITEFKPVLFSLNTDEHAQCKYSFERTNNYEDMKEYPLGQNKFSENHTFAFSAPSVDSLNTYNTIGDLSAMYSDMNMYVRCQDYHGNYNLNEYVVNFCINQGPDLTPPIIMATAPKQGSYLPFGDTEKNLDVYLNEPAECRVDSIDRDYRYMGTNMACETNLLRTTDFGWKCHTTLTGLDKKENNFYIRCKDQPWLIDDVVTGINWIEKKSEGNEEEVNISDMGEQWLITDSITNLTWLVKNPTEKINGIWRLKNSEKQEKVAEINVLNPSSGIIKRCMGAGNNCSVSTNIQLSSMPWLTNNIIKEGGLVVGNTIKKIRNANTHSESFVFTLKSSTSELEIVSVSPSGEINRGFEPITVELEASTSGGAKDGEAVCFYKFSENGTSNLFFDTYSHYHKQSFDSMMSGGYTLFIECEDDAGNIANANTDFVLNLDTFAPIVTRVYYENNELKILTDEEAECYYDFNKCNFDIDNASPMTTAFSKEHSASKVSGQTYHIQCRDIWGNKGNGCSIEVKSFD